MDIIFERKTDKSFEEAVLDLKESLKAKSFGVLVELNLKDKLKEKGQDFNTNFLVLEVCNPEKAKTVLEKRIEAGYMLPCKMVVYEKEGAVWLGMQNPKKLIELVGDESLKEIAEEVYDHLSQAILDAV